VIEQLVEGISFLGAEYDVFFGENEARNGIDAHGACGFILFSHQLDVLAAFEQIRDQIRIHTHVPRDIDQLLLAADVRALGEIALEQALDDNILKAGGTGPPDQAMGINGIRRPANRGKIEWNALDLAHTADIAVDRVGLLFATELLIHIVAAIHTLCGHFRIELKGPPANLCLNIRSFPQGALEAALAYETPGTDRVGDDVDVHEHGWTISG
tara:strand:- start:431 stop:1069 length:639 start_codon:yes stop_codon:yes gene_type:complete